MVQYNPKEWFSFIFQFHKADTFRKLLPMMFSIAIYSFVIEYLYFDVFHVSPDSKSKTLSNMHTLLGLVLSLLLVFRTNTAYDRWWEGRKLWGALVNNSRNLAIKLNALLPEEDEDSRIFFRRMIPNYAFVLKNHLRKEFVAEEFEYFPQFDRNSIRPESHVPNQVASYIIQKITHLQSTQILTSEQVWLLNGEITAFTDICGACERIRNTPIPFSYSSFIKKFIFFYTMTLPFGYVLTMGYWMMPVSVFVFYVLASLEIIAEEIESPFGTDANDLPTDQISKGIRSSVRELI